MCEHGKPHGRRERTESFHESLRLCRPRDVGGASQIGILSDRPGRIRLDLDRHNISPHFGGEDDLTGSLLTGSDWRMILREARTVYLLSAAIIRDHQTEQTCKRTRHLATRHHLAKRDLHRSLDLNACTHCDHCTGAALDLAALLEGDLENTCGNENQSRRESIDILFESRWSMRYRAPSNSPVVSATTELVAGAGPPGP